MKLLKDHLILWDLQLHFPVKQVELGHLNFWMHCRTKILNLLSFSSCYQKFMPGNPFNREYVQTYILSYKEAM